MLTADRFELLGKYNSVRVVVTYQVRCIHCATEERFFEDDGAKAFRVDHEDQPGAHICRIDEELVPVFGNQVEYAQYCAEVLDNAVGE